MFLERAGLAACLLLTAAGSSGPLAASEEEATSLGQAFKEGTPVFDLRLRYEQVDDVALADPARAWTLRTVLGFRSLPWKGLGLHVEAEDTTVLGSELYNNAGAGSSNNGIRDRPVVADPDGTELNQIQLFWQGEGSGLKLGRQEIVIGDSRFVGNVGWRQNHQSFDAFSFESSALEKVTFFYGYVDRVNTITRSKDEMASHLGNAAIGLGAAGKLTLYSYLLDYDDPGLWALSSTTWGAELVGSVDLEGGRKLLYELEYATQSDWGDNPGELDSDYTFAVLGLQTRAVTVRVGYELLDGSARDGQFRTPLATLHAFNGWADKFLATPTNGLEDLYLQVSGRLGDLGWLVRYHDFSAATGGASYGKEVDLQLLYRSSWGQTFGLKGALYDADQFSTDTDKWTIWTGYKI